MQISHETVGEVEVLRLHGSIATGDDRVLLNALHGQLRAGRKHLVLNLQDSRARDKLWIGSLISLYPMIKGEGSTLVLVGLAPWHGEQSDLDSLSDCFDVYDREGEAIASFS